jgi:hypothetical protein
MHDTYLAEKDLITLYKTNEPEVETDWTTIFPLHNSNTFIYSSCSITHKIYIHTVLYVYFIYTYYYILINTASNFVIHTCITKYFPWPHCTVHIMTLPVAQYC